MRFHINWNLVAEPAKRVFIESLKDKVPDVRVEAVRALRGADGAVVSLLFAALNDEDRYVYHEVCWSLVCSVDEALPDLLKGLRHEDATVRGEVACLETIVFPQSAANSFPPWWVSDK
jgi:HEAT repeats